MKKIGSSLCQRLIPFMIFISGAAWAEVRVEATIDRSQVNVGDSLVLTVAISSDQGADISEPRLPMLKGFELLQRWTGSEARSTFPNGQVQTMSS